MKRDLLIFLNVGQNRLNNGNFLFSVEQEVTFKFFCCNIFVTSTSFIMDSLEDIFQNRKVEKNNCCFWKLKTFSLLGPVDLTNTLNMILPKPARLMKSTIVVKDDQKAHNIIGLSSSNDNSNMSKDLEVQKKLVRQFKSFWTTNSVDRACRPKKILHIFNGSKRVCLFMLKSFEETSVCPQRCVCFNRREELTLVLWNVCMEAFQKFIVISNILGTDDKNFIKELGTSLLL